MALFDFIKKSKSNGMPPAQQMNGTMQPTMPSGPNGTNGTAVPMPTNGSVPPISLNGTNGSNGAVQAQNPIQIQPNPNQPTQSQQQGVPQAAQPQTPTNSNQAQAASINKAAELDLLTHFTERSNSVFKAAQQKAIELKSDFIDSEHLLHGLIADKQIYQLFVSVNIQPQAIEDELTKIYKKGTGSNTPSATPRIKSILDHSLVVARKLGYEFISPEHILLSAYNEKEGAAAQILTRLGLKEADLNQQITGKKKGIDEDAEEAQNILEKYTIDLTQKAREGKLDPVVERSDVIERTIHILSRRTKNNPALIGEAGVGKTAIVEGLAQKIIAKQVPETFLNKRLLQLDLMSLIAGASHRGDFENRIKGLIEEIQKQEGSIILFIDELHNIVGAGSSGEGSLDASNFFKPALSRGHLQMIGATTLTEYRKYIEKDPALERRFQPIVVPEPTEEQTVKMLMAIKDKYEAYHKVSIPQSAIEAAVSLSKRYVGDRFLPDKAVDLLDEAAAAVRLPLISLPEVLNSLGTRLSQLKQELDEAKKQKDDVKVEILQPKIDEIQKQLDEKQKEYEMKKAQTTDAITSDIIRSVVARWTGIPVDKISESETHTLSNLEDLIHERLINQEEAVSAVAAAVRRSRAGLKSKGRPIGSFVFLGPTGVGKTELAKSLAEILFGHEDAMIRLDMTEFMQKHEVAKLLGAPPGYVGYEEGGKLTEAVRRKPYSVVLFDEIEKAHKDIFNILLQILDDGRLTDNKGHTISFKNTVIICTSNIATEIIQKELLQKSKAPKKAKEETEPEKEVDKSKMHDVVMNELNNFFRPELVNRFDEVIIFEPLKLKHMTSIVQLQLLSVKKLLEDQQLGFSCNTDVVDEIVRAGFDPVFGARPLRRTIQKLIENPLSQLIIDGEANEGDRVDIGFIDKKFTFKVVKFTPQPNNSNVQNFTPLPAYLLNTVESSAQKK